jgi:hypothetical protein
MLSRLVSRASWAPEFWWSRWQRSWKVCLGNPTSHAREFALAVSSILENWSSVWDTLTDSHVCSFKSDRYFGKQKDAVRKSRLITVQEWILPSNISRSKTDGFSSFRFGSNLAIGISWSQEGGSAWLLRAILDKFISQHWTVLLCNHKSVAYPLSPSTPWIDVAPLPNEYLCLSWQAQACSHFY